MKNKLAIFMNGFMDCYLDDLLDLCKTHNISVDLIVWADEDFYKDKVERVLLYKDIYNGDMERNIKELINIDDYDYVLSDVSYLSFACNVFHGHSTAFKKGSAENFLYRKILQLGHWRKILKEKNRLKNTPKNIAVSKIVKDDYSKNCGINPDRIIVCHPGFSTKNTDIDINGLTDVRNKPFTIGVNASGFTSKGGYNVLMAFRQLKKKYSNKEVRVKFINPSYNKQWFLKLYLKLTGLDKYVEFLPFQKDMNAFYSSLDCLACPSRYETFGRVVTEAMLRGTTVIVAQNVGASDIINDGENGFVYAPDNTGVNLANKIEEVMHTEKDLVKVKANAVHTAKQLTWANFAKGILFGLYDNLNKEN